MNAASSKYVYVDYDGVLQPDSIYWFRSKGIILVKEELPPEFQDCSLFCYADILVAALEDFPDVKIILSTSWVPTIGYSRSRNRLPEKLRSRVVGATYHSQHTPRWHDQTRYQQILDDAYSRRLSTNWIAIDNDAEGWPDDQRERLVHTDDNKGIDDAAALEKLRGYLLK